MKKLTLTFCALFALFAVAAALYADGPEKYSGKEKEVMQPAPPVCDFYRAHEWDLDIWGAYAFAADTGRFPFGRFAPYVSGGIGFIDGGATLYEFFNEKHTYAGGFVVNEREFLTTDPVYNNHLRALGQIGAGLEFRVTCHIGLMADFTWNFVFGQEDHADRFHLITEQGQNTVVFYGQPGFSTTVINQAVELRPGHGSDNQDFGMA